MTIFTESLAFNADVHTPVELYLSLRNDFRKACLLESNDYHDRSDSKSLIGLEPILEIKLIDNQLILQSEENPSYNQTIQLDQTSPFDLQIQHFLNRISFNDPRSDNGFFGRFGFEFALLTENHITKKSSDLNLPDMHLFVFKYILVIDHFKDQGTLIKNSFAHNDAITSVEKNQLLIKKPFTHLPFEIVNHEKGMFSDDEFRSIVLEAQKHCKRGDVFQLVLSNAFKQPFFGDDFVVYRELRRLNPSPYLFYFDFEDYRLFGSSPEAQVKISSGTAEIHPIAGTVVKTGDSEKDIESVKFLKSDEKENAEHTMLVDLARNDLSKNCSNVKVKNYKEIQEFSHVFHIVSKVVGTLESDQSVISFNHSFPAGTLSGSPKPKALELIAKYEHTTRDFYGGAIGLLSSNGDVNLAIVIRSLLSKDNQLHYRAGAGIVLDSIPDNECAEVHNKLRAVRTAIKQAHGVQQLAKSIL